MRGLTEWIALGFRHIADLGAMDHLFFLVALVAPYRFSDWRRLALVASAFTLGHSVTLGLTVLGRPWLPTPVIEFLIPVTIVLAALANLRRREPTAPPLQSAAMAFAFGLIHGAGFANFLGTVFPESIAQPLFGFNLGIELGQLLIILVALAAFAMLDQLVAIGTRAALASLTCAVWAFLTAWERVPW